MSGLGRRADHAGTVWAPDDAPIIERRIEYERHRLAQSDKEYENLSDLKRAELIREFLARGLTVEERHEGLVLLDKFLIGVQRTRWCTLRKRKWYWYKDLDDLLDRYILNQSRFDQPGPVVAATLSGRGRCDG